MEYPTITKEFHEQLDILRYLARDKKASGFLAHVPFIEVRKDFERMVKLKGLGRELKPGSYKRLTLSHLRHGEDNWEIRVSADRLCVKLNKDNWKSFVYWVRSLQAYAPDSAAALMHKYPHVKVKTWGM